MHWDEFFLMLHYLIQRLMLLAPSMIFLIEIKGKRLMYMYKGLSMPSPRTTFIEQKTTESEKEIVATFKSSIPFQNDIDPASTSVLREVMHKIEILKSNEANSLRSFQPRSHAFQEDDGHEMKRFRSESWMKPIENLELRDAKKSIVGVCFCKSDRFWKHGRLNAIGGVTISSKAEICDLLLYDHYGVMENGIDQALAALQKGRLLNKH